eukprot:6176933-Prymnesium_polylepis.1
MKAGGDAASGGRQLALDRSQAAVGVAAAGYAAARCRAAAWSLLERRLSEGLLESAVGAGSARTTTGAGRARTSGHSHGRRAGRDAGSGVGTKCDERSTALRCAGAGSDDASHSACATDSTSSMTSAGEVQ